MQRIDSRMSSHQVSELKLRLRVGATLLSLIILVQAASALPFLR